jgi:hypothetical protein
VKPRQVIPEPAGVDTMSLDVSRPIQKLPVFGFELCML